MWPQIYWTGLWVYLLWRSATFLHVIFDENQIKSDGLHSRCALHI